jgi:predicted XRE-type DNA-binding protein
MFDSDKAFCSIWHAIEDSPAAAENMRIRTSLMTAIRDVIEVRQLSQAEAAQLFNETQPRISELQRGKIDLFSVDRLINMLAQGGMHVEVSVKTAA